MKYDSLTDELQPSTDLMNGDSDILKSIAANVKEWSGNWDAVWGNVMLRADIKQDLLDLSEKAKNPEMLEAPFVIQGNDQFHRISYKVLEETGGLEPKRIRFEWNDWLKDAAKKTFK
ncbi:hypothetical protein COY28_04555 [Candidatus Woesearchaeota archaeon CG_4_10_14_0_2_um_filter_57_5]|nr:MAG: hypothetical protein COY28_04555 [Candidatus Woesearchaeota archaeon CG_4_10_14_0_2_um_filter_57_5]